MAFAIYLIRASGGEERAIDLGRACIKSVPQQPVSIPGPLRRGQLLAVPYLACRPQYEVAVQHRNEYSHVLDRSQRDYSECMGQQSNLVTTSALSGHIWSSIPLSSILDFDLSRDLDHPVWRKIEPVYDFC